MVVLINSRGPLCVGRQQRALSEWQDIIYRYPDHQNGHGSIRRHRVPRGGGGGKEDMMVDIVWGGGRIILAP